MPQLLVVAASAIGLIVFVSFVIARLLRARTAGMSIRMQVFLALASIVGAFAFGLGLLVLDRIKARADLLGREAAVGEARAVAAVVQSELKASRSLPAVARQLEDGLGAAANPATEPAVNLALLDPEGRALFAVGRAPDAAGTVWATVPVVLDGQTVAQVRVVKPTLEIRQTLADFAPTVLVISLLLGTVAAVSAALIGGTIATPIEQLTSFAERVSEGDLRAPLVPAHGREVTRLARALDSMRRELQGRPFVETFAADLSHELKNPVAAIRASAEVLRDGAFEEPEQAAHFSGRILESTRRIEALLGDLLSLARLEARGVEDAEEVDVGAQARRAVEATRERGTDVSLVVEGSLLVRGDPGWLARAIENLVDNARLHGDGREPIEVTVRRQDGDVSCTVQNAGEVNRHVAARVFRRFVTTRGDRGGTGLGLAIVRAIAEAHGGVAECVETGPPSVVFRIRLPGA